MKPSVELVRLEEDYDNGTFGVLKINKEIFCMTLEPRDELNAKGISSIPAQQYTCRRYTSDKYPDTFQVMNVPGRSSILFHAGNAQKDTEGCILLGSSFNKLKNDRTIINSGITFNKFLMELEGYKEFTLTIIECY